jgi:transposase-like protein
MNNIIVAICKKHGRIYENISIKAGKNKKGKTRFKCKECNTNRVNKWKEKNKNHLRKYQKTFRDKVSKNEYMRWYTIKRKFNISKDQYNEMLFKQNKICAICKKPETMSSRAIRGFT